MRYFSIFLIFLFFQGCASKVATVNKSYSSVSQEQIKPNAKAIIKQHKSSGFYPIYSKTLKKRTLIDAKHKIYTGSIKGTIKQLAYNQGKKSWLYVITSHDTANYKLAYVMFYHDKKLANKGDLVYAILKNSHLQNLFFIKKANRAKNTHKIIRHKHRFKKTIFSGKGRATPNISLPEVENITF